MYPQDFPVERFTPVIDLPMILAGLFLIGLAVAAGYAFARLGERDRKPSPRVVATSIHAAIQRKLNGALAAHGGATSNAAQALVDEIENRLGDVARLTGDLGKASGALKDALAGKRKAPPAPPSPPTPPACSPHAVIVPIPGQAGSSAASAAAGGAAAAVAEVSTTEGGLVGAIVNLSPPPPPPAVPPAPYTAAEQTAAVRAAVEAFAVHWGTTASDSAASARIDELEAAAIQLTTLVPAPKTLHGLAHGSAHS